MADDDFNLRDVFNLPQREPVGRCSVIKATIVISPSPAMTCGVGSSEEHEDDPADDDQTWLAVHAEPCAASSVDLVVQS